MIAKRPGRVGIVAALLAGALVVTLGVAYRGSTQTREQMSYGPMRPTSKGVYTPPVPGIRGSGSGTAIPGSYMVVLRDTASLRAVGVLAKARTLVSRYHGTLGHVYRYSLLGFSMDATEADAQRMAQDPDVSYVDQNQVVQVADTEESPPSWGLDRVDQQALPLDTGYTYDAPDPAGPAVTAYVIDTGIRVTLPDFDGRASFGWDMITNTAVADDCNGHGTHVAGILGGARYGVAKNVRLVAVRVFGCDGKATPTSIQDGIEWVTAHAVKPAVVNVSIGTTCKDDAGHIRPCPAGTGSAIIQAIKTSISTGLPYAIAAGNDNINACGTPYGLVPGSIVVGATAVTDAKATYSNWGSCVDLWAPGGDQPGGTAGIWSDYILDTPKHCEFTCELSGTSMATPHVAGAIARLLARPGWADATPARVKTEVLTNMVTTGKITGLDAASPNKLLYIPPPPVAGGSSIAVARNQNGSLVVFGVTPGGALQVLSTTGGTVRWTQSINPGWYTVAAQSDGSDRINMIGLQRTAQNIWLRKQSATNANEWVVLHQIDGLLNSVAVAPNDSGQLEAFGSNSQGQAWHSSQAVERGVARFGAWEPFDLPGVRVRSVAADLNVDGLVEVFALTSTGQIWHRWETAKHSHAYTPWIRLDFDPGALASVAVARNKDGLLELFGVTTAGQVYFRDAVLGNSWLPWTALTTAPEVGTPRSIAAETNTDGRVELFTVNSAGQLWHRWQTTAGSDTYTDWTRIASDPLRP